MDTLEYLVDEQAEEIRGLKVRMDIINVALAVAKHSNMVQVWIQAIQNSGKLCVPVSKVVRVHCRSTALWGKKPCLLTSRLLNCPCSTNPPPKQVVILSFAF
jgi:hypothetical protein